VTISAGEDRAAVEEMLATARRRLLGERVPAGYWVGELSSSALSTATAAFALHLFARSGRAGARAEDCSRLAAGGLRWLAANQNDDGGWGDTTRSLSNISATALCWAALRGVPGGATAAVTRAESWLKGAAGSLEPSALSRAISLRYGKDRTFSVPILTMCAAAGVLGGGAWRHVPQLPFELAALPRGLFAFLRLPVVSYALPALIAIGYVRHRRRASRNPLARVLRELTAGRTLRTLQQIQPRGGGFLEATPLTSFVVISLVSAGGNGAVVVSRGVDFLVSSVRGDGSWPIDSNLATWVTTLSVNALAETEKLTDCLPTAERAVITGWLLGQQYRKRHPYTGAAPGGWAWTDLPGGVPDADDTAGALLALRNLGASGPDVDQAAHAGVRWLLDLQNRDGGIPTFCRGWGALPFDRSTPELTAHALHAWGAWHSILPTPLRTAVDHAAKRAINYLRRNQSVDGAWTPLWFGNEGAANGENPTYGTARVIAGVVGAIPLCSRNDQGSIAAMVAAGARWLLAAQHPSGGWGGAAGVATSVEETCHAIRALTAAAPLCTPPDAGGPPADFVAAVRRGTRWLMRTTQSGHRIDAAPIGLYFARLWYWERLYPLVAMSCLS
jgi:squalene-hopene/tetraprenyl-beta-curcumene cyclase